MKSQSIRTDDPNESLNSVYLLGADLQVINLRGQLENFMNVERHLRDKLGDEEANALLAAAVFLLNIGSNDYFAPFQVNSSFFESRNVQREYVNRVVGNLTSVIQVNDIYFYLPFFYKIQEIRIC